MSNIAPERTEAAETSEAYGYVALTSRRTHLLFPRGGVTRVSAVGRSASPSEEGQSGIIYTDAADMPSLEELLRQREVAFAVLERPAPSVPQPSPESASQATPATDGPRKGISPLRIVTAAMIPAATGAVGWTLLADSISDDGVQANPYAALILALVGFVLLASLLVALRGRH